MVLSFGESGGSSRENPPTNPNIEQSGLSKI